MTTENQSKSAARDEDTTRGNTTLASRTHEVADEARQVALDRVEAARTSVEQARERAAEKVRKFGGTVRKIGEHMRVEDQFYIAEKANDASQRLDTVASYLSSAELATLASDARDIARRNPGLFYGSALVLGLAAGRFLRGAAGGGMSSTPDLRPQTAIANRPGVTTTPAVTTTPGVTTTPAGRREPIPARTGDTARMGGEPSRSGAGR